MRRIPLRQIVHVSLPNGRGHTIALSMDGKRLFERFTDGDTEQWHEFEGPTDELANVNKARRRSRNRSVSVSKPR